MNDDVGYVGAKESEGNERLKGHSRQAVRSVVFLRSPAKVVLKINLALSTKLKIFYLYFRPEIP